MGNLIQFSTRTLIEAEMSAVIQDASAIAAVVGGLERCEELVRPWQKVISGGALPPFETLIPSVRADLINARGSTRYALSLLADLRVSLAPVSSRLKRTMARLDGFLEEMGVLAESLGAYIGNARVTDTPPPFEWSVN